MTELPFKFDNETVRAIAEYDPPEELWDEEADEYVEVGYEEGQRRQEEILRQFEIVVPGERDDSIQFWVFVHKATNRMFRFDASYDSWSGTGIDYVDECDVYEVKPVDRTVRFYEPINS